MSQNIDCYILVNHLQKPKYSTPGGDGIAPFPGRVARVSQY